MNATVTIMQSTDWSKYCLEDWLYQFGAWMYSNTGTCGRSVNPIAVAMDEVVKKQKPKKVQGEEQIIADWINDEAPMPKARKNKQCCEITDNEARAVQRLILDMQGRSDVLDGWLSAVIDRYFYGTSIANMVNPRHSLMEVKFDLKCGLAALHCRYPFIPYKIEEIDNAE